VIGCYLSGGVWNSRFGSRLAPCCERWKEGDGAGAALSRIEDGAMGESCCCVFLRGSDG